MLESLELVFIIFSRKFHWERRLGIGILFGGELWERQFNLTCIYGECQIKATSLKHYLTTSYIGNNCEFNNGFLH
jgi:hypothetical protein